jgi:hypothetical protein
MLFTRNRSTYSTSMNYPDLKAQSNDSVLIGNGDTNYTKADIDGTEIESRYSKVVINYSRGMVRR